MAITSEQWVKRTGGKKACLSNEKAREAGRYLMGCTQIATKIECKFPSFPFRIRDLKRNRGRAEMEQEACQWRMSLITIMRHFETLISSQQRSHCPVQAFKPGNEASFLHSLFWNVSLKCHVAVKLKQNHHDMMVGLLLWSDMMVGPSQHLFVLVPGSALWLRQSGSHFLPLMSFYFLFSRDIQEDRSGNRKYQ